MTYPPIPLFPTDGMSQVICRWASNIHRIMPTALRLSPAWDDACERARRTSSTACERARCEILTAWLWDKVVPLGQDTAGGVGFGPEWGKMSDDRDLASVIDVLGAFHSDGNLRVAASDIAWVLTVMASGRGNYRGAAFSVGIAAESILSVVRAADKAAAWDTLDPVAVLHSLIAAESILSVEA